MLTDVGGGGVGGGGRGHMWGGDGAAVHVGGRTYRRPRPGP